LPPLIGKKRQWLQIKFTLQNIDLQIFASSRERPLEKAFQLALNITEQQKSLWQKDLYQLPK